MTENSDTQLLLDFIESHKIAGSLQVSRGWDHIGAILADAALQRRQRYKATVYPRVQNLVNVWPDAATSSSFRRRIDGGGLAAVIKWRAADRLEQIDAMLRVFENAGIETAEDLRRHLNESEARESLRRELRQIRNVGPKTVDYIDIVAGLATTAAVDVHMRRIMAAAGITNMAYQHISNVIHAAAHRKKWRPADLDAALWAYSVQAN